MPITLREGDVFRHIMAGGGYGRALDRDAERVRDDVRDGKLSRDHARAAYGVVLADDPATTVDVLATQALRLAMTP